MEVGDLVIVCGSPLVGINLFGYKNGDIGLCMEIKTEKKSTNVLIWFDEDKKFWVPKLWVKILGK